MKGATFSEVYDAIYYGADIDMQGKTAFYHISSGRNEQQKHCISVYLYDAHPDFAPTVYHKIYDAENDDATVSLERFMQAPIFDGRSLYEAKDDMTVIYL